MMLRAVGIEDPDITIIKFYVDSIDLSLHADWY